MELLDVYNQDRNFIGKVISYNQINKDLNDNEFCLMTILAIFNEDNEMLIHKRQATKPRFPNLWDVSVGGITYSGETTQMAIERNLLDKLNYKYDLSKMIPNFTVNVNKWFCDVYTIKEDIDINDIKVEYQDVQNLIWASKEEVIQLIEEEKFVKYNKGFIELLFNQNLKRGILD